MKPWKKCISAIMYPHAVILSLLIPLSALALVLAFTAWEADGARSYAAFALSAYTLTALVLRSPRIVAFVKKVKRENALIVRLSENGQTRATVTLFTSLVWNIGYAIFQFSLGLYHKTAWYTSLAIYYTILAVMRASLLGHSRRYAPGERLRSELNRYRLCGVMLALTSVALTVIVGYMVAKDRTFVHHPITVIGMAAYTFTALSLSVVGCVRRRRDKSPLLLAKTAVSLAAALVSMLTLTTTMLTAFDNGDTPLSSKRMLGATGAGVFIALSVISVYILIDANKRLRTLTDRKVGKENSQDDKYPRRRR